MTSRALFLSCSRTKISEPKPVPAIARYDGPLFRVLRRYLDNAPVDPPKVWIISAEHGVIQGDKPIAPYDRRMDANPTPEFLAIAKATLLEAYVQTPWKEAFVCGGEPYRRVIMNCSKELCPRPELRIADGGIGGQASRLRSWLYGNRRTLPCFDADTLVRTDTPVKSATLLGVTIQMSPYEILERAESWAKCDKSASRFETWYVQVGAYRVAPKWLVSKVFKLPVHRFRTADARRILVSLGLEVQCVADNH